MSLDRPEMSSVYAPMSVEWKEIVTKAGLTAGVAAVAAMFLIPEAAQVSIAGVTVPGAVAVGLGAGAGSVTGDLAHKYVLPHIPQNQKYQEIESAAISVGAAIGGSYLAMSAIGDTPLTIPLLIGGGSYITADYVNHRFLDSRTGGIIY